MARLDGRVALVTGGLRGIGQAIAARFCAEGATVVITDLDAPDSEAVAAALAALGGQARYVAGNVTSEEDWARIAADLQSAHGGCHILVNNAGIDLTGAVETLSLEAWRRIMAINVDGVFLGTRALVPIRNGTMDTRKLGSCLHVARRNEMRGRRTWTDTCRTTTRKHASDLADLSA